MKRLAPAVLCLFAACSKTEPAILVQVLFQNSETTCAKVAVKGLAFDPERTGPLRRDGGTLVKVGLSHTPELGDEVKVFAEGFLDGNCVGAPVQVSPTQTVRFPGSGVVVTSLVLGPLTVDGGMADGGQVDGGPVDSGAVDGGSDAGVDAGTFDGGTFCFSCAQQGCDGVRCEDGNPCSGPDTCMTGICTPGALRTCPLPGACQTGAALCLFDGGCAALPVPGPCDGGTCTDGVCRAEFSFAPSNFDAGLPANAVAPNQNLNCTDPTFDSSTLQFTNWCGAPPVPVEVPRALIEGLVVLPMRGLTVATGTTLHLKGDRPVILAVYGDAVVDGRISADSSFTVRGAGAGSGQCGPNAQKGTGGDGSPNSGAGAGGGGLGKAGGSGGAGLSGGGGGVPGAKSPGPGLLPQLRGGCPGGDGAVESQGGNAAVGGQGGGAIQLSVSGKLTVRGVISALGNGGRGAKAFRGGGGGGGSGGAILLEANNIRFEASRIVANGGSGGAGALNNSAGGDGFQGVVDDKTVDGAQSAVVAGNDGFGGRGGAQAGDAQSGNGAGGIPAFRVGGGGAGGGVGLIFFRSIAGCTGSGMRVVSPAAETDNCP